MKKIFIALIACYINVDTIVLANDCIDGYELIDVPYVNTAKDGVCSSGTFVSVGAIYSKKSFLGCPAGSHYSNWACVTYSSDPSCPENYYSFNNFARLNKQGECPSGYNNLWQDTEICLLKLGYIPDSVCTPQLRCDGPANTLNSTTGLHWPIWLDKVTEPSLAFVFDEGTTCYLNLQQGEGGLNIQDPQGNIYHGVE